MADDTAWWKEAVVYQIYPRSFNDTDGDGVGDLQGIIERLDYVAELGVDVIWLNPVYDSPQRDNGYDIRDYRAIDSLFGDMDDWERLLEAVHDRDMRLVMDLVVNHTSRTHEWFRKSRRSEAGHEDHYVWRAGDPDEAPNNWDSFFGGSAWEYDDLRGAHYLHLYDASQPDLNWDEPAVREAIHEIIDWWLRKGIDGFRMDVINLISKPEGLPDGDPDGEWVGADQFVDGPRVAEYLRELDERVLSQYDAMTVGEMPQLTVERAREYTGADGPLDMAFHFQHAKLDYGERGRWSVGEWDLQELKRITERWQSGLAEEGWNALYWENHDQPRVVSRYGDPEHFHHESATLLATYLMTLRGTPFIYQGQELGMTNCPFDFADLRDVDARNHARDLMGEDGEYADVRDVVEYRTRDNARTPMQWTDGPAAGFTDGDPWIRVNTNHERINVAAQRDDPDSVLAHYRELIALRKDREALVYGDYEDLLPDHGRIFAFRRTRDGESIVVVLNVASEATSVDLPVDAGAVLYANYDEPAAPDAGEFRPYEAVVYEE